MFSGVIRIEKPPFSGSCPMNSPSWVGLGAAISARSAYALEKLCVLATLVRWSIR